MADKLTKLSQAIRYGSTFLGETQFWMEGRTTNNPDAPWTCGCALGTAYLAFNGVDSPAVIDRQIFPALSKRFSVPLEVLRTVSSDHYNGHKTRAQCADWLESLGY